MLTRTYEQLLEFYESYWELKRNDFIKSADNRSFFERTLGLLKIYSREYYTTHGKTIAKIITPLLDAHKRGLSTSEYRFNNTCHLLFQISLAIPKEKLRKNGGLAALLEVVRKKTGIDIFIFYENCNIRKLQQAIMCHDISTMQAILDADKTIAISEKYKLDDIDHLVTPLEYMLSCAFVNNQYPMDCVAQGIHLFTARDRSCINHETIIHFEKFYDSLKKQHSDAGLNPDTKEMRKFDEIHEYLKAENSVNNIILFICGSKIENFCQLPFIPQDVINEICFMTIQSTLQEGSSTLALIKRLLREYAIKHQDTEQKEFAVQVNSAIAFHETMHQAPFFQNPGMLLYFVSANLAKKKPSDHEPDGFHDGLPLEFRQVLKKISVFTSIDIKAFYRGTPLTLFYTTHYPFMTIHHKRANNSCMIDMILRNKEQLPNAAEEIKLIFEHPYCSTSNRSHMVASFALNYHLHDDKLNLLHDCVKLFASHEDIPTILAVAVAKKDYHLSTYMFCHYSHLIDTPPHFENKLTPFKNTYLLLIDYMIDQIEINLTSLQMKPANPTLIATLLNTFFNEHGISEFPQIWIRLLKNQCGILRWDKLATGVKTRVISKNGIDEFVRFIVAHPQQYREVMDKDTLLKSIISYLDLQKAYDLTDKLRAAIPELADELEEMLGSNLDESMYAGNITLFSENAEVRVEEIDSDEENTSESTRGIDRVY